MVGEQSIIKDSENRERVIIEITESTNLKFDEVDEALAKDEGDLSLEYWRNEHEKFFTQEGVFSNDMSVCFNRFKVIEVLLLK